jgi:hypothetical protein
MLIPVPRTERADVASWVLLILGLLFTPILIGIILIIIALSRGFTIKTPGYFECPNCKWNSRTYARTVKLSDAGKPVFEPKAGVTKKGKTSVWVYLVIILVIFAICILCSIFGPCGTS